MNNKQSYNKILEMKKNEIKYYNKKNDYDKAQVLLDESLALYPYDCELQFEQGIIYMKTYKYENAINQFKFVIEMNDRNKDLALLKLGVCFLLNKKFNEALEVYDYLINSNSRYCSEALFELAKLKKEQGNTKDSEYYLKMIIENGYRNMDDALLKLAGLEITKHNDKKALNYLKQIKNKQKNIYVTTMKLILLAKIERDYDVAKKYYLEVIKIKGSNYNRALLDFCALEIENKHIAKAKELIFNLEESNLKSSEKEKLNILKVKLKEANGQYNEAEIDLENMLLNNCCKRKRVFFELGLVNVYNRNYDKAINYFDKLIKKNEENSEYVYYSAILEKIYILIKYDKLDDIINLYNEFLKDAKCYNNKSEIELISDYINIKLGNLDKIINKNYRVNQLISFNYNKAIEHIKNHCQSDDNKKYHSVFNENIKIEPLYKLIQTLLNKETFIRNNVHDAYVIYYPNIGFCNDEKLDYLKVITNPNSKDIITMYPIQTRFIHSNCLETIEEEIVPTQRENKVKRLTQIEKFNQKYKNFVNMK